MYVPDLEVHEAATLEDAALLLRRYGPGAKLLAGGTDLLIDLKTGRTSATHLISIKPIKELRGIRRVSDGVRIGALTTVNDLRASPLLSGPYEALRDAAGQMAAVQVRNSATVGGNVAGAVPCADLPPVLLVLSASALVWSPVGERIVPLEEFFVGPRRTVL